MPVLEIDDADYQIIQTVNRIYHNILQNYIARANEREVLDALYKFYTESGMVLINKQQLKIYQELEKQILGNDFIKLKKE